NDGGGIAVAVAGRQLAPAFLHAVAMVAAAEDDGLRRAGATRCEQRAHAAERCGAGDRGGAEAEFLQEHATVQGAQRAHGVYPPRMIILRSDYGDERWAMGNE